VCKHFSPLFELGLTATPQRNDQKDIKKYFGAPVFAKKLAEGIAEGWLAEVEYRVVFDDAVKEAINNSFKPKNVTELKELFKVKPRNDVIVQSIERERREIGLGKSKTIIFCASIQQAKYMANKLGGKAYHSDLPAREKRQILLDFRDSKIHTICTRDMFNEGVDIPDARLVVFLRSTSSGNIFEQQLGRGLRKAPGKTKVTVLDFVANLKRIIQIRNLGYDIERILRNEFGHFTSEATQLDAELGQSLPLRINQYADFEFSEEVVNLLAVYDGFKAPDAPSGYRTIRAAAKLLGTGADYLENRLHLLRTPLRLYRLPNGRVFRMLSPQQQNVLKYLISADGVKIADRNVISLFKLSRLHLTSVDWLEKLCGDLEIPVGTYQFAGRRPGRGIEKKYLHLVAGQFAKSTDIYTVQEVAQQLGTTRKAVAAAARRLELDIGLYRGSMVLSPEQIEQVKSYRLRFASIPMEAILEKYNESQSIQNTADSFGVSWNAINKRLKKAGVL
jgi:hypothetical protein